MIEVGDQVRIGESGESIFVVREVGPDERRQAGGPGGVLVGVSTSHKRLSASGRS
ncbi:hypothetical protein AB0H60_35575 [Nocardia rhamnosiphila]|uniref:hypothetical protein n=1 Tax=Nocardia rhamnosiphila TaxID=426716 RepID=UPI0033EEB415